MRCTYDHLTWRGCIWSDRTIAQTNQSICNQLKFATCFTLYNCTCFTLMKYYQQFISFYQLPRWMKFCNAVASKKPQAEREDFEMCGLVQVVETGMLAWGLLYVPGFGIIATILCSLDLVVRSESQKKALANSTQNGQFPKTHTWTR